MNHFLVAVVILIIVALIGYFGYKQYKAKQLAALVAAETARKAAADAAAAEAARIAALPRQPGPGSYANIPAHCHSCDNAPRGSRLIGCSKGIDYASTDGTILPGTPVVLSEYKIVGLDPPVGQFNINGDQYWYRQEYADSACPAKYTGTYNAQSSQPSASGPLSTEVCEPGCWPGECTYKPTTNWLYNNSFPLAEYLKSALKCKINKDAEACNVVDRYGWAAPGDNMEAMLLPDGTGFQPGHYNKGPIYFADYQYSAPGKKFTYRYGNYHTDGNVACPA